MNQVIKIQSEQGSFDVSGNKNLCDFIISAGQGSLNLRESHINVNFSATVANTTIPSAVYNTFLEFNSGGAGALLVRDNVQLVRNVEMVSQQYGMLETIKDVNKIRGNLKYYERNDMHREYDMDKLSASQNHSTFKPHGFTELYTTGEEKSRYRPSDVKIPLKDLMNVCDTDSYDTSGGDTRLHLEFDFAKLEIKLDHVAGYDTRLLHGVATQNYFIMDGVAGNLPATINSLTTTNEYADLSDSPWFVGMAIDITANINSTGIGNQVTRQITKIEKAAGSNKLVLTFDGAGYGTAGQTFTTPRIVPSTIHAVAQTAANKPTQIVINKIELVAKVNSSPKKMPLIYSTYMVQNDSYTASTSTSRNYEVPPMCKNMYLVFDTNIISTEAHLDNYRITIDNKQVVNRAVKVRSFLHYDLINRVFTNNNKQVASLTEQARQITSALNSGGGGELTNKVDVHMIMCPVPFKNVGQRMVIELNASGGNLTGRHAVYFEVMKTK